MIRLHDNAVCRHRDQRGIAMVEFVIVLPLFLLLIFATAELGRLLYQYNALTKAVRDGARYAAERALNGTTGVIDLTDTLKLQTQRLVVYGNTAGTGTPLLPGLTPAQVAVTSPNTTHVAVSVLTYSYQPMVADVLPSFGYGAGTAVNLALQTSVIMRAL